MDKRYLTGQIFYAIFFLGFVPLIQWCWALQLEKTIRLTAIKSIRSGLFIITSGILLIGWAMFSLKKFGKGLPMNAFPPPLYVKKGPYRFFRHPIYWGYSFVMTGAFILIGSASGLWIVTPISILAIIALVMGYEKIDLEERFKDTDMSVLLEIPPSTDSRPTLVQRIVSLFCVVALLTLSNYIIWFLNNDVSPTLSDSLAFEFVKGLNGFQFLAMPFILFVPFIIKSNRHLHRWIISTVLGIGLSTYIALLWPSIGAQYFYLRNGFSDRNELSFLLSAPAFLTLLSAHIYSRHFKKWRLISSLIAVIIIFSQLTHTKSVIANLLESVFIFLISDNYSAIWSLIRGTSETIANSWKEWLFGPVRIINHGIYVGLGSFAGILFCGLLIGPAYAWAILLFAFIVTVFSAFWAQIIEGSDRLKRPFGFYGGLVGILFASIILWWAGYNIWVMIGIISVVMPWVQAAGRLRCLINGCCHGKPTNNTTLGIRYFHYRSRVCNLSGLKGKYLHPTPVYSIIWLFVIGFLLLALWLNKFSYPFIFGMYLVLTGIGRFVEEAYRGEVQTPVWKGLRLYQWAAILSVLTGIVFTTINLQLAELHPGFGWQNWVAALLGGFFVFFVMGVDFPRSDARFSRLV